MIKTITYTSYKTSYNRHIRKARNACSGLEGWSRAETIRDYFRTTRHPHVKYTFDQLAMNRSSDSKFPITLMKNLADLTAKNETGYLLEGDTNYWIFEKLVGDISLNDARVCRYSINGPNTKQLITVEYDGKVHGDIQFENFLKYEEWADKIMEPFIYNGLTLMSQIANRLDDSWTWEDNGLF